MVNGETSAAAKRNGRMASPVSLISPASFVPLDLAQPKGFVPARDGHLGPAGERDSVFEETPFGPTLDRAPAWKPPLLARKLSYYVELNRSERDVLAKALSLDVRRVRRRTILLKRGESATKLSVMLGGWACRYKVAPGGRRQVVAFYLPGDVCDFSIFMAPELDSTIELIDGAEIAGLPRGRLAALSRGQPRIVRALWRDAQSASSIQREWMVNIAQRSAIERTAHLLSEFVARLDAVGLYDAHGCCDLPITQADFGDACGMTAEHANRCLRELRDRGVAAWKNGRLSVPDRARLDSYSGFDPAYLQLKPLKEEEPMAL
jgi:CRP-like cAMP-binding protein